MQPGSAGVSLSRSLEGANTLSIHPVHAMNLTRTLLAPLALLAGLSSLDAQGVGSRLPEIELEGYSKTKAKDFGDFQGRAVLIEFFAYW